MKVFCGVRSRTRAPSVPPARLVAIISRRMRKSLGKRFRYAPTLATMPGHSATVEVALAWMGGTRVRIRAGNDMKVPPPATEFITPASPAAPKSNMAFARVIELVGSQQSAAENRQSARHGGAMKTWSSVAVEGRAAVVVANAILRHRRRVRSRSPESALLATTGSESGAQLTAYFGRE